MPQPNVRLRHERQLRGWSQGHLAEHIDVPDYYISRWERGEVQPSPFYQQKLCELFGKSAEALGFLQPATEAPLPGTLKLEEGTIVASADPETNPGSKGLGLTEDLREQELFPPSAVSSSAPLLSSSDRSPTSSNTGSLPFPLPAMPITPSPVPPVRPARPARPLRHRIVVLGVALLVLLVLAAGSLTWLGARPAATPAIVGQVYFLSSGQLNDATNQGMADQVQVQLHALAAPAAGKSYYAWLLPDVALPENPTLLLGKVVLTNGTGHLFYQDPQYTNLLTSMSRFLITEEDATTPPLTPSTDTRTWRYQAQIPQVPPQASPGEASYSLLDHVRHVLASDPTVHAHGLTGGLIKWLVLNSGKLAEWSSAARGEWRPGGQYISLKGLLGENRNERIKQADKVKKLLMRLKGLGRRHIPPATGLCLL